MIGRRVLESLCCDVREMQMAARDEYGEDIDVVHHPAHESGGTVNEI